MRREHRRIMRRPLVRSSPVSRSAAGPQSASSFRNWERRERKKQTAATLLVPGDLSRKRKERRRRRRQKAKGKQTAAKQGKQTAAKQGKHS